MFLQLSLLALWVIHSSFYHFFIRNNFLQKYCLISYQLLRYFHQYFHLITFENLIVKVISFDFIGSGNICYCLKYHFICFFINIIIHYYQKCNFNLFYLINKYNYFYNFNPMKSVHLFFLIAFSFIYLSFYFIIKLINIL